MTKITFDDLPEYLTVREFAELFRVAPLTIKRRCNRGEISFIRMNTRGDKRIPKSEALRLAGK